MSNPNPSVDTRFQPGVSGNPSGRPKDTMKEYLRQKLQHLTPEEKEAWLIEHNVSGELQFRMAEGNPTEDRNVKISVPTPILGGSSQAVTLLNGVDTPLNDDDETNVAQQILCDTTQPPTPSDTPPTTDKSTIDNE